MHPLRAEDVESMITDLFNGPEESYQAALDRWFSPDYMQVTDGHVSDYDGFVAHATKLRSIVSAISVEVVFLCQEDNKLSDRHIIRLEKKDGSKAVLEVLMLAERDDQGRMLRIWETARTVEGEKASEELARVR